MAKHHSASEQPAGSPAPGEPVFLVIGKLRRPHGLHGEIIMEIRTEFPERIMAGGHVYVGIGKERMKIKSIRPHLAMLLVSFSDLDTAESVSVLRNQEIFVKADQIPQLEEGEYYHHEIIGMQAVLEDGEALGEVVEILETGANDVLVVQRPDKKQLLLPLIDEVILHIDLAAQCVIVRLMPGLDWV